MKRIIYKLGINEQAPDGAVMYVLPVNGDVVDAIVSDDFTTTGTILYDSANNIMLNEPFVHHFAGWEI